MVSIVYTACFGLEYSGSCLCVLYRLLGVGGCQSNVRLSFINPQRVCARTLSSFMNFKHCSSLISHCTINWSVWDVALDSFVVCVQSFLIPLTAFLG